MHGAILVADPGDTRTVDGHRVGGACGIACKFSDPSKRISGQFARIETVEAIEVVDEIDKLYVIDRAGVHAHAGATAPFAGFKRCTDVAIRVALHNGLALADSLTWFASWSIRWR